MLGKPVMVENRAGGGGWVGWGALAQAQPDGYTIGYLNVPSMYAGYLDKQYKRNETLESFTPLMNHVLDYNVWAVKADSPFKSVKDVIEAAKKAPESITVTAFGAGSDDHLAILSMRGGEQYQADHRASQEHRGGQDRRARRPCSGARRQYLRGRGRGESRHVRILGVMAPERSRFLPDAPTFKEQGFNQVWSVSRGIAAPANLPKDVEAKLDGCAGKDAQLERAPAEGRAAHLEPRVIKGAEYKKFLKDNEGATQKLMGW